MPSILCGPKTTAQPASLLTVPLSVRNKIYTYTIQSEPKPSLTSFPLTLSCHQIQTEFTAAFEYQVNKRARFCLGRSLQDRETSQFYAWNYHTAPWASHIEIGPEYAQRLKTCVVRCTVEELGDWERRAEPGAECFKDCIRILVRTFKNGSQMRQMSISFDHFALSGKKGMLNANEIWDRVKALTAIPGLVEIRFETPGFSEDFTWKNETNGKKGRRKSNWTMTTIEKGSERGDWNVVVNETCPVAKQCGVRAPKGYGFRRGIT